MPRTHHLAEAEAEIERLRVLLAEPLEPMRWLLEHAEYDNPEKQFQTVVTWRWAQEAQRALAQPGDGGEP